MVAVADSVHREAPFEIELERLDGSLERLSSYHGRVLLIVNTASHCGKTPQYAALQTLQDTYAARGFTVLGFPCNQFNHEEPGSAEEIADFCSLNYGVTFPMFSKISVNGRRRHPLYQLLTRTPDDEGAAGDVQWNFEKFVVARDGRVARRFRPPILPDAAEIVSAIEALIDDGESTDRSA